MHASPAIFVHVGIIKINFHFSILYYWQLSLDRLAMVGIVNVGTWDHLAMVLHAQQEDILNKWLENYPIAVPSVYAVSFLATIAFKYNLVIFEIIRAKHEIL